MFHSALTSGDKLSPARSRVRRGAALTDHKQNKKNNKKIKKIVAFLEWQVLKGIFLPLEPKPKKKWQHVSAPSGGFKSTWFATVSRRSRVFLYVWNKFSILREFIKSRRCYDTLLCRSEQLLCLAVMKACEYVNLSVICTIWQLN